MSELIVVTGAAGALGRAVVTEFLGRGATVAAVDQNTELLRRVAAERVHPVAADLTDPAGVSTAWQEIDTLGRPAALVCVAGGFDGATLQDTDAATLHSMLSLNLSTMLWPCRAAAARMRGSGGAIVTVGSRTGVAGPGPVAYAAAKAAVVRATEVLADELRPDRIRVNCVLPSVIDTPANRSWMSADAVARAVSPAALAKVVAFLCSADASPISGVALPVYGDA